MRRPRRRCTLLRVRGRVAAGGLEISGLGTVEWQPSGETIWSASAAELLDLPHAPPPPFEMFLRDWIAADHAERLRRAAGRPDATCLDETLLLTRPGPSATHLRLRASRQADGGWVGVIEAADPALDPMIVEENRRLRRILEVAPAILWRIDRDGSLLWSNQTVGGAEPKELVGLPVPQFVHEKDREGLAETLRLVFEDRKTRYYEAEVPEIGWFGGLYAPLIEDGQVVEAVVAGADVTARRTAENEARESESTFRSLADSTPLMMWLLDTDRRPEWANRALLDFVAYTPGERVRGPSRLHPADFGRASESFMEAWNARVPWETEVRLERFDGEFRNCRIAAVPRNDENGRFAGYAASAVDVTEIRRAEAATIEHRHQLAHLLRIESLDQMALGLAHELHQPLAAISAAAGAAVRGLQVAAPDLPRVAAMLREARTQAIRGGELLQRMRDFIRKSAQEPPLEAPVAVDLNDLVKTTAELTRPEAVRREVHLGFVASSQPVWARANSVPIQQVLINLIQNGLEAMTSGSGSNGRLQLQTKADARTVSIHVHDDGPGLPPGRKEQIFDVFFTTRPDGLGMGLSISRSIVESYGGTLSAYDRESGGACFTITLPRSTTGPAPEPAS